MLDNIMLLTDSYKVTHWKQYPPNTQFVYSYLESRGGQYSHTVFFGLQYLIKKFLTTPITKEQIDEAESMWTTHFGGNQFNRSGWEYILNKHNGFLPLEIKAVQEGSVVPTGNVLMTIENTDPMVPWLTNWMETVLMQIWYPTTVATQSYFMKRTLLAFLESTGTPDLINFKLHDFGFRGSTSVESAGIGGAAHLVNFMGTDTSPGFIVANRYYGSSMAGFSIPAAEHSTITSWGKNNEADAYENMLTQYPTGLVAVVSDSYDIYNACENIWGNTLKDKVLVRDGCLVIRPDSGDPHVVLIKILNILENKFGSYINNKGYKVLNDKIRIIQGDGIDAGSLFTILNTLKQNNWSADNIAFGSGGGLLQKVNRDTCKFAIKCSNITINNTEHDVYKDPVTDSGKTSKKGRLILTKDSDKYVTTNTFSSNDLLEVVYRNGYLLRAQSLDDIRTRTNTEIIV